MDILPSGLKSVKFRSLRSLSAFSQTFWIKKVYSLDGFVLPVIASALSIKQYNSKFLQRPFVRIRVEIKHNENLKL